MADDIATEKQVSMRSHKNDIATGGGTNRSDIDTGVDSIIATCR